ncbi:MAG: DeoR/GlpR family DNA-binding transcription regulator [Blautia producta]|nr:MULTISPECIES: DeoR/GlpR family DNA-binding transcription regulator [Blautia]MCQ4744141.1 DeoR/GlpR family DNA-binding transcription regulator [Blautia producta]MDT4371996.1 DeoR/GlpR family DNA-binding transcription regulator [Blautia coccoides]MDU5384082.1 DeoR/GlpR family DNA-binding transcription regulator [Blautia producta]MDU6883075.1 DeoR/GlpR family DNA-binding transcription regulator [Blautia producta]
MDTSKEKREEAMLQEERKQYILSLLNAKSSVTVAELSKAFQLSEVSVRKMLMKMEKQGEIKRTWGGAVSVEGSLQEYSHSEKVPKYLKEKLSIAKAAYECISDGDAIMLDSGTTTLQIARLIKKGPKRKIMVTTNAINIAMELAEAEDIPVVLIGGEVRHRILCCTGNFADEMVRRLFFDKGFVSGNHLSLEHGFTTPNIGEANFKRAVMNSSKESFIVLDHSKFGDDSLSLICPIKEIDTVLTDWGAPIQFVEQLRLKGVRVICGNEPVNYWKDTVV